MTEVGNALLRATWTGTEDETETRFRARTMFICISSYICICAQRRDCRQLERGRCRRVVARGAALSSCKDFVRAKIPPPSHPSQNTTMIGMHGMLGGPSRVQIEEQEDLHMKTAMHKCQVRQCGVRMPFKNVSPGCRSQVHRRVEVAMGGSKDVCTCT